MANEQKVTVRRTVSFGGISIGLTDTALAPNGISSFQQTIPAGTNTQVNLPISVANSVLQAIESSTACTIKTNSTSAPAQTITLGAAQQQIWDTSQITGAKLFTTDVTALFVTNAADTILKIIIGTDETPTVTG